MHVVWASSQRTRSQGCAVHLFVVACLEMRIRTLSRVYPSVQTYCPCQERSVRLMWMGAPPRCPDWQDSHLQEAQTPLSVPHRLLARPSKSSVLILSFSSFRTFS